MSIIKFIEEELPKLSRQERKVAIKVMKDPEQVQKMSISVLAKSTQVSNATITRFVKKMNCHDFYEFKLQLANDLAKKEPTIKPDSISSEVYNFYNNVLDSTAQRIDPDQLKKVVNLISNGQRIYLFGIGSSGYTASEMTQRLLRMGISAFAMTDSDIMYISSSLMNENDVVLALSSSGGTDDINNAIAIAQSNGAKVIGITSFKSSKMYELVDYPILVSNSNFVDNSRFINSQFAMTYALDIITTMLLENETYSERLSHTVELILDKKFQGRND